MSIADIRDALEIALASITPEIATAWESVAFEPTPGIPYQAVNLLFAEPENPTMGGDFHRERGIIQITLAYPIDEGPQALEARAQLIRDAFPRAQTFTRNAITVIIEKTPEISPGQIDGDRRRVPVKIRFFANITGG